VPYTEEEVKQAVEAGGVMSILHGWTMKSAKSGGIFGK
jgi:hypothetical protein